MFLPVEMGLHCERIPRLEFRFRRRFSYCRRSTIDEGRRRVSRVLKWVLVVLGVLVLALAGAGALVAANLDAYLEDNRAWLEARAEAVLGREVRFERIGVSFDSGLGVEVANLEVADDPRFGSEPFLKAEAVMVVIRLWPALQGSYEVEKVALVGPDVTLRLTSDGANTDTLGAGPSASEAPASAEPAAAAAEGPPPMVAIALADIRGGRVRLVDSRGEQSREVVVEQLDVELSDLSLDEPVAVDLSAAVLDSTEQNLRVSGSVGPIDAGAPGASAFDLALTLLGVQASRLVDGPLVGSFPEDVALSGPLDVRAKLVGTMGKLGVELALGASDSTLRYAQLLDKRSGSELNLELEGTLVGDAFEIASSSLRFDRAVLTARGLVTLGEPLRYELQLASRGLPLAGWEQQIPPLSGLALAGAADLDLRVAAGTADAGLPALEGTVRLDAAGAEPEGLPRISGLSSVLRFAGGGVSMGASDLKLHGTPVRLAAKLADLTEPAVVFDLSSPELTAEALGLAPDSGFEVLRDVSVGGEASNSDSGGTARATVRSQSGRASGADFQNLEAELRYRGSVVTVDRLVFDAYQGKVGGQGQVDLSAPEDPAFDAKFTLRGVDLKELAAAGLVDPGEVLEGRLDSDFELTGRGSTTESILATLTGDTRIEVVEGLLRDINLAETAIQSVTGVPGLTHVISPRVRARHPGVFSTGDTLFDTLRAFFAVEGGQVRVKDMKMSAKDYAIVAGGSIGLDGRVNIQSTFTASRELTRSLIGESKTVRYITGPSGRLEVPMRVGGSMQSLSAQPDITQLTSRAAANAASSALSDLINKKLGGKRTDPDPSPSPAGDEAPTQPPPPAVDPLEDLIRRSIEDLL
jgi:AsmA protein